MWARIALSASPLRGYGGRRRRERVAISRAPTGRRACRPGPHGVRGVSRLSPPSGAPSIPSTMPKSPREAPAVAGGNAEDRQPGSGGVVNGLLRSDGAGRRRAGSLQRWRRAVGRCRDGCGQAVSAARTMRSCGRRPPVAAVAKLRPGRCRCRARDIRQETEHEWLAVRIRPEAEAFVERPGLAVDGLHDDGACADQVGRRKGAPRLGRCRRSERTMPAVVVRVDRELDRAG